MSELDDEELLEAIRKNREARGIRAAMIEQLRLRAVPRRGTALVFLLLAIATWVAYFSVGRQRADVGLDSSWILEMTSVGVPIIFVLIAYRCVVPNPRDRFLLLLAQEAVLKSEQDPKPEVSRTDLGTGK